MRKDRELHRNARVQEPHGRVCQVMAEMLPSTAEEIAEACGLDSMATAAYLDELAASCRVMFNPLTKRFSLPKGGTEAGRAA